MKKALSLVLALVMMFSLSVIAFADENVTTLTTEVPAATYTLTIPADKTVTYGVSDVGIGSVVAEAVSGFAVGKDLQITVAATDLICEGVSTKIPYRVVSRPATTSGSYKSVGEVGFSSGSQQVLTFKCTGTNILRPADSKGNTYKYDDAVFDRFYLYVSVNSEDWGKALAGTYTATMTFTAEIVAAEA